MNRIADIKKACPYCEGDILGDDAVKYLCVNCFILFEKEDLMNMKDMHKRIVDSIRRYFEKNRVSKAVIGLSGGIDSAVVLKLAVDAIGNKNVTAFMMPELEVTPKESTDYAEELCHHLSVDYCIVPINTVITSYRNLDIELSNMALANTKARIRSNILYSFANTHRALVLGTGNKTEFMLGYFTKHGDGACDILPIGNLWKTQVIELAKHLKIPNKIIQKTPSAELYPGQTDEEELGGKYSEIDEILKKVEKNQKVEGELADKILERMRQSEHKRKPIFIVKLL